MSELQVMVILYWYSSNWYNSTQYANFSVIIHLRLLNMQWVTSHGHTLV